MKRAEEEITQRIPFRQKDGEVYQLTWELKRSRRRFPNRKVYLLLIRTGWLKQWPGCQRKWRKPQGLPQSGQQWILLRGLVRRFFSLDPWKLRMLIGVLLMSKELQSFMSKEHRWVWGSFCTQISWRELCNPFWLCWRPINIEHSLLS
jgi:hypothetical protein